MKRRKPNYRLIKIHRSYTVEEIAELFGLHKNTVRNWIKSGLPTIDKNRPIMVLGIQLEAYLKNRRTRNKQTCKTGELYCFKCRTPKFPAENMADYTPVTKKFGNLTAIYPDCTTIMNQRISNSKLEQVRSKIELTFPKAQEQLNKRDKPSVNSDFR